MNLVPLGKNGQIKSPIFLMKDLISPIYITVALQAGLQWYKDDKQANISNAYSYSHSTL